MSEFTSPVPMPAADAVAPDVNRDLYGMPIYFNVPTPDLTASADFWTSGLGFIELFAIPGRVVHLRRWAFQDVLLVPGERADSTPAVSVTLSCVPGQIEEIAARCEKLVPGCTDGPREMPWNSVELTVVTPENARVVMTAALPLDPGSARAAELRAVGFKIPEA